MRAQRAQFQLPVPQPTDGPPRLLTVAQLEAAHPALKGRVRSFVVRADCYQAGYDGLREAVVRIGRSVYIDEPRFLGWVQTHRGAAPAQPRNPHGRGGRPKGQS